MCLRHCVCACPAHAPDLIPNTLSFTRGAYYSHDPLAHRMIGSHLITVSLTHPRLRVSGAFRVLAWVGTSICSRLGVCSGRPFGARVCTYVKMCDSFQVGVCVGSPHTSVGTYHDHLQAWFLACGPFLGLGRNVWFLPGFGVMCDSFQVPAFLFGLRSGFTIPFLAGMLSGCTSVLGWFLPRLVVLPRFLDALLFLCELRRGWSYARASVGWRGPLQAPSLRRETYVRGFPF